MAATTSPAVGQRRTLPYSLIVHSYSNVSLHAGAEQAGYEPGAQVKLHATLAESGLPISNGFMVAEAKRPDGTVVTIAFSEQEEGRFIATFDTAAPGVYHFRLRAQGRTRRGLPFTRERALTAAVWHGGDRDADPTRLDGGPLVRYLTERDARLCELLNCLTSRDGAINGEFERRLRAEGLDMDYLRRCLELFCREREGRGDDV